MYYLLFYDVGHMVKDHSESERGNLLPPLHGLFVLIAHLQSSISLLVNEIHCWGENVSTYEPRGQWVNHYTGDTSHHGVRESVFG